MRSLIELMRRGNITMVNKNKIKGTAWERKVAEIFNENLTIKNWKRVPGSGALGTILEISSLRGDVKGNFNFIPQPILIEAKTGYGGSRQLTIKKDWLDKMKAEADTMYGISLLACKFLDARSGVKNFIVMDMDDFLNLISNAEDIYTELLELISKEN